MGSLQPTDFGIFVNDLKKAQKANTFTNLNQKELFAQLSDNTKNKLPDLYKAITGGSLGWDKNKDGKIDAAEKQLHLFITLVHQDQNDGGIFDIGYKVAPDNADNITDSDLQKFIDKITKEQQVAYPATNTPAKRSSKPTGVGTPANPPVAKAPATPPKASIPPAPIAATHGNLEGITTQKNKANTACGKDTEDPSAKASKKQRQAFAKTQTAFTVPYASPNKAVKANVQNTTPTNALVFKKPLETTVTVKKGMTLSLIAKALIEESGQGLSIKDAATRKKWRALTDALVRDNGCSTVIKPGQVINLSYISEAKPYIKYSQV
ncbi:MAG: hypothetical protein U0003_00810 [Vampirovibrionales bacterium]